MNYLFVMLVGQAAFAGNVLTAGSSYPVKKELTSPAPAVTSPKSFYVDMVMDFQSFDAGNPSAPPVMSTRTEQLMKFKKLPVLDAKDPAFPKDGFNDRMEFTFEKLITLSRVVVPGMKSPFETRADLGTILSDKPLLVRGDGRAPRRIDNLDSVKNAALAQTKDMAARTTLSTVLREDLMLKATTIAGPESSCLGGLVGKKPGDKWKFSAEEQGVAISFDCTFEGWSEALAKKIAVLKVHSNKQRVQRQMPNGTPGMAETEGDGEIYFEPTAPEILQQTDTKILVEPAADAVLRMKARGESVPRNRSTMQLRNHVFPL
jgi:hypothetical protein